MPSRHNLRFVLICLFLFIAGFLLRLRAGWLVLPWFTASPTNNASTTPPLALPPGLAETVMDFYQWLDRGDYQDAFQVSLENKWQARMPDTYVPIGLVPEVEFIQAATEAWGVNGADLTINQMMLVSAFRVDPETQLRSERPELYTLAALPPGDPVEEIYEVGMSGSLLERCAAWQWSKHLLVARLASGGWRILLSGVPNSQVSLLQVFFLDQNPLAGLNIQEK